MSETLELNERLKYHSDLLLKDSREYAKLARAAVDARNTYDLAKARARLLIRTDPKSQGWSVAEKDAEALLRCEFEMTETRIAEAHVEAMGRRLRAVEASLSAIQSQVKLLKTEMSMAGYSA